MSRARRFFWGRSLPQALAKAARYHGVAPELLDYRRREKRHGFVKHPRAVIVEVDPDRPARQEIAAASSPRRRAAEQPASPLRAAAERSSAATPAPAVEAWDAPDEESELAAAEAARRLLAFAGLDLTATVRGGEEGLEIDLDGADRAVLLEAGPELLDALEALLPRAITALAGRHVRCRVDGAGQRAARERDLAALAGRAAERARANGEELLPPLPPAERRLIHLFLREESGLATESVGRGVRRRVRVFATDEGSQGH